MRAVLLLLLSATAVTAQTPNANDSWATAFDRLDRTSRSILDGIRCVQELAAAREGGVFGRDADAMQEWACVRQQDSRLALFLTFDSTVTLPAGVQVLEIGSDYLLGLGKGPMDEEQVRMYRVRR